MKGTVKWFNRLKGYGFIHRIEGKPNLEAMVHYSTIQGEGYRNLDEGDRVKFDLVPNGEDRNGNPQYIATNVQVI